jgi:hypothetical protein
VITFDGSSSGVLSSYCMPLLDGSPSWHIFGDGASVLPHMSMSLAYLLHFLLIYDGSNC